VAWGQAYKSHLEKILKLQKRALRFIYFSERNQHTIPLFIDASVLRNRNAPGNIQDLFQDIQKSFKK